MLCAVALCYVLLHYVMCCFVMYCYTRMSRNRSMPATRCLFLKVHAVLHCKKELAIFPSPAGMSLTKLSLGGKKLNYSRPGRVWSVTSRLGTGKRPTLFNSVGMSCLFYRHREKGRGGAAKRQESLMAEWVLYILCIWRATSDSVFAPFARQ